MASHEVEEFHLQGSVSIQNLHEVVRFLNEAHDKGETVDVGLQVSHEGRMWVCVDGMALLRFKPGQAQMYAGNWAD